jgi:hypothetical protein
LFHVHLHKRVQVHANLRSVFKDCHLLFKALEVREFDFDLLERAVNEHFEQIHQQVHVERYTQFYVVFGVPVQNGAQLLSLGFRRMLFQDVIRGWRIGQTVGKELRLESLNLFASLQKTGQNWIPIGVVHVGLKMNQANLEGLPSDRMVLVHRLMSYLHQKLREALRLGNVTHGEF